MCTHKILAHNPFGYIARCQKCNHFQIGFGTTALCLTHQQYSEFRQQVRISFSAHKDDGFPHQKSIQLPTFCNNIHIVVNFNELRKLTGLMLEANLIQEVETIISNKVRQN